MFCLGQNRRFGFRLGRKFRTGSGQQQGTRFAYLFVGSSVQAQIVLQRIRVFAHVTEIWSAASAGVENRAQGWVGILWEGHEF